MIDPRSIRPRIALIFVLIITSVLAATGAWNYFNLKAEREEQLAGEVAGIGARLSTSLPPAVWDYNEQQISETVNSEMSAPFMLAIDVSSHGKSVYSARRGAGREDKEVLVPIDESPKADIVNRIPLAFTYQGKRLSLGEVTLYVSRQSIVEHQQRDLYSLLASIFVTNLVLLFSLYLALRHVVLKPLERLQEGVSALEEGRAAPSWGKDRDDEVGRLSNSFHRMAEKLQAQLVALQERESYLRLLLDTLAEGLVVRGRHHEVFDFNHSLLHLFQATSEELGLRRSGGES
jgi:two-component system NtrC family sensor kinase